MNRIAKRTILSANLSLIAAVLLLCGLPTPAGAQPGERDTATPPPATTKSVRTTSSPGRNTSRASRERAERELQEERAERELVERERAKLEADLREARRQVAEAIRNRGEPAPERISWAVATLINKTAGPIPYQLLLGGKWNEFTLPSGHMVIHPMLYEDKITIRYDYQYGPGYQEKRYYLVAMKVVGHEPTESERQRAPSTHFVLDASGDITMETTNAQPVWSMFTLINKTAGPIPYLLQINKAWKEFTLPAGHQVTHTAVNENEMLITYDYRYEEGPQTKQYKLLTTSVFGHEPSELEKLKARVTHFELDKGGNIEMYAQPE